MTRNVGDTAEQMLATSHLSRCTTLGFMGTAAAASLVGGRTIGLSRAAKAQTQSANGRVVGIEARSEAIASNTAETATRLAA